MKLVKVHFTKSSWLYDIMNDDLTLRIANQRTGIVSRGCSLQSFFNHYNTVFQFLNFGIDVLYSDPIKEIEVLCEMDIITEAEVRKIVPEEFL